MRLSLEICREAYNAVLGDRRVHISFRFGNFGPERRELEPVPWGDDSRGKKRELVEYKLYLGSQRRQLVQEHMDG